MSELLAAALYLGAAPLLGGLLAGADRVVTARMQGRIGPPVLQPFYDVAKLLRKDTRAVNPIAEPLLLGHVGALALAGALAVAGTDLLFCVFVAALGALCLVLAAGSVGSPYSFAAAERELIVLLATEPLLILMMAGVLLATGAATLPAVLASPSPAGLALPGVLICFLVVGTVKLRKSPFDVSASHHVHQELVRGLTSDMSGRLLALVEVAHWYEIALLALLAAVFFPAGAIVGPAVFVAAYALEVLLDNSTSRATWQLVLRATWATTLVLAGGNLVLLFVTGA
ncbi:MAG TPA: NADH-quinone oxidoreductase subunit H [Candidatus Dormibacteraeota bacterium]|nr:NADH-quinone oxidoreductase subunit H [Candidatus Dormibacteraeota bacterium]